MKYLWCSCKVCNDFEFREYLKHKKQGYDDNYPNRTLTVDELIRLASNMYNLCTCKDGHVWGSKLLKKSELVALKTEVGKLKKSAVCWKNHEKV